MRRRWSSWRRHFWLTGILEDGRLYDFVGPLEVGFLLEGETAPLEGTSPFEVFGAIGQVPRTAEIRLTSRGGRQHRLAVATDGVFELEMDDGAYVIHEGIATFDVLRGLARHLLRSFPD